MLRNVAVILLLIFKFDTYLSVEWDQVHCSSDSDQNMPEGISMDIGRFPWLGVIQHTFYMGGTIRYAVTTGILVHPAYVIASAEDIGRILPDQLLNNTKFIAWQSAAHKYSMSVRDVVLNPEFENDITHATLAILELIPLGHTGVSDYTYPVLPICLPMVGSGTFADIYAVKMNDDYGELQKEVRKMTLVSDADCDQFYLESQLTYKKMRPLYSMCAKVKSQTKPCVWDAGAALVTRQSWGHWKLLGFSVRGPGCGAPARFLNIHDYISWIDDVITNVNPDEEVKTHKIYFRRVSPVALAIYPSGTKINPETGQCERGVRGNILYKDNSEILTTKNFAQGFFYVSVHQVASFMCAVVELQTSSRSNVAFWVEHNCHRDVTGITHGHLNGPDFRKIECFLYFKSTAYIEFRFFFSFRALIEMAIYGVVEVPRRIPNPFVSTQTTDSWEPTNRIIKWGSFAPYYKWYYWM